MKVLVVNADDYGYSKGVNKGIIKAHTQGIVTSTSVMVYGMAAKQARELLEYPLSVGLHFDIFDKRLRSKLIKREILSSLTIENIKKEFKNQINEFAKILGKPPDHLDSHHHIHFHSQIKPIFEEYSKENNIPVRGLGKFHLIESFFGKNESGETDLERISTNSLLDILSNLADGVNELMCHPGFADLELRKISTYSVEREEEIKTLIDRRIIEYIKNHKIKLQGWDNV